MTRVIYSIFIFIFLGVINFNLFAQSSTKNRTGHKQQVVSFNCGSVNEYREVPKDGVANIICPTTGFNPHRDACWQELAEYYYNVAPEPGVKIQHLYFVEVPKGTNPIRTLTALKNSPFKQKTFFRFTVNMITEKYTFKKYPFASK